MPPQIIRHEKYIELTDIWFLGVMLYFMMFKKLPWTTMHSAKIPNEITIKINNGLVLSEDSISAVIGQIIEKMLVIKHEARLKSDKLYEYSVIARY
jgi:serine/threonine protein kinase